MSKQLLLRRRLGESMKLGQRSGRSLKKALPRLLATTLLSAKEAEDEKYSKAVTLTEETEEILED